LAGRREGGSTSCVDCEDGGDVSVFRAWRVASRQQAACRKRQQAARSPRRLRGFLGGSAGVRLAAASHGAARPPRPTVRVTARWGRHALPCESRLGGAATPYRESHGLVGPPRLAVGGVLFPDYMSARKRGIARSTRMVVFRMTYGPITAETIAADFAAATCPRDGGGYRLGQGGGAPEAAGTARVSIHDVSGAFDAGDGERGEEGDAGVRKGKVPSDQ
jgi:hypothetical protein